MISKLPGRNRILVVFPAHSKAGRKNSELRNRLDGAGIEYLTDGRQLDRGKLWADMAQSQYVILREGKHTCASWRLIDSLCMGANIVLEQDLKPEWSPELTKGVHYLSLGLERGPDGGFLEHSYVRAFEMLKNLSSKSIQYETGRQASHYFDQFAAPDKISKYLISQIFLKSGVHLDQENLGSSQ